MTSKSSSADYDGAPNEDRNALGRFINKYNIHSFKHLAYHRSLVANNLIMGILDHDTNKKIAKYKRFAALPTISNPKKLKQ